MPMTTLEKLARKDPYWDKTTFRLGTQAEADNMGITAFSVGKQMPSKEKLPPKGIRYSTGTDLATWSSSKRTDLSLS